MFGSDILDVAIGLVFVYSIFSMLTTTINEWIVQILKSRARTLKTAIGKMLEDADLGEDFYKHILVKSINTNGEHGPSYVDSKLFSKVVTDVLFARAAQKGIKSIAENKSIKTAIGALIEKSSEKGFEATNLPVTSTLNLLNSYAVEADDNLEAFKKKLEEWFNDTMARVAGYFTRNMKWLTLLVGLLVAIAFNVDTFEIGMTLSSNSKIRVAMVQSASSYLEKVAPLNGSGKDISLLHEELTSTIDEYINPTSNLLGIGWNDSKTDSPKTNPFIQVLGWIVTALAISLGAPFWFDILNKIMKLRSTGKKEDSDQKPQPVG